MTHQLMTYQPPSPHRSGRVSLAAGFCAGGMYLHENKAISRNQGTF